MEEKKGKKRAHRAGVRRKRLGFQHSVIFVLEKTSLLLYNITNCKSTNYS